METTDIWFKRECVRLWLTDVRNRERECRDLEDRVQEMRQRLDGMGSQGGEGVSGSKAPDRMADGLSALQAVEDEWSALAAADSAYIAHAVGLCLPRHTARWVCWLHWAEGRTWAEVGRMVGYSEQHVRCDIADEGVADLFPHVPDEIRAGAFPNAAPI